MISAITLRVTSMTRSLKFYRDTLGLKLHYGGEDSSLSSFDINGKYLNLQLAVSAETEWGRVILYSDNVNELHAHLASKGYELSPPTDAPWGERYFHIKDPDGHEISIAQPLRSSISTG